MFETRPSPKKLIKKSNIILSYLASCMGDDKSILFNRMPLLYAVSFPNRRIVTLEITSNFPSIFHQHDEECTRSSNAIPC